MKRILVLAIGVLLIASVAYGADQWTYNPFTLELDNQGATDTSGDSRWLKLDQTTQQTVINDEPIFEEGIAIGDGNKTIKKIDANTVGLYVQSELMMAWINAADVGTYQGWGAFTYAE